MDASFSVIIPVYNYGHCLQRAVDSVLEQGYEKSEIIIVDDGSIDDSAHVAENLATAHPGKVKFIHQQNAGPAAARNRGITAASHEWLVFLDADDALHEHALNEVALCIEISPRASVLIGEHHAIDKSGIKKKRSYGRVSTNPEERWTDYLIDKKLRISNGAIFFHRRVFEQYRFPEHFRNSEDMPVFAYAIAAFDVAAVDATLVDVYKHDDSLRHNLDRARETGKQLVEEIFSLPEVGERYARSRKAFMVQRCLSLFRTFYQAGRRDEALGFYREAFFARPSILFRLSYTRKLIRALFHKTPKEAQQREPR